MEHKSINRVDTSPPSSTIKEGDKVMILKYASGMIPEDVDLALPQIVKGFDHFGSVVFESGIALFFPEMQKI